MCHHWQEEVTVSDAVAYPNGDVTHTKNLIRSRISYCSVKHVLNHNHTVLGVATKVIWSLAGPVCFLGTNRGRIESASQFGLGLGLFATGLCVPALFLQGLCLHQPSPWRVSDLLFAPCTPFLSRRRVPSCFCVWMPHGPTLAFPSCLAKLHRVVAANTSRPGYFGRRIF
jgi:hypothetical protein